MLIIDCLHTENTDGNGGPQADEVGEQQLSSIRQQLKEKCVCPRRTRMDTDGGPQADDVSERELSGIKRELKKKLFMEINGIFMAIHVQKLSMLFWG